MYTIEQLAKITGLTTRTLRNYIKSHILQGSKDTGIWMFTEDQVRNFIADPSVSPSIRTKQLAIVYDFLAEQEQSENESCFLLDKSIPECKAKEAADFFCQEVSLLKNIRFSYTYRDQTAHFILKGPEKDIAAILQKYYTLF